MTVPISPIRAATYRLIAAFVALAAAVAIIVYVPDPGLKVLGAALAGSAVLAIEEFLKNQ